MRSIRYEDPTRNRWGDALRRGPRLGTGGVIAALAVVTAVSACDDEGATAPQGPTFMQAALTGVGDGQSAAALENDDPVYREVDATIESAEVWISEVYFQGVPDEGTGRKDVFQAENEEDRAEIDLMELEEGVTVPLGDEPEEVVPGTYGQLRLVVDSAHVHLADGYTFSDGSEDGPLAIPSGDQTGIKVLPPREDEGDEDEGEVEVAAEENETVTVVVAVDVADNFVFQGPPGEEVEGILFTPTLRQDRVEVENNDD